MGKILTVPNIILTPPGARNLSARGAGTPFSMDRIEKIQRMFGTDLIGLYVGNEPPGSTAAVDHSPFGFHGTYTSVNLGQQGIDERTCPLYDGSTSFLQPPMGFRSAFNPMEFTLHCGVRVFNAGVWTDAATRRFVSFRADASNWATLAKGTGAGNIGANYIAGGTNKSFTFTTTSPLWFFDTTLTVSKSGDAARFYFNGVQQGAAQNGLGVWVGSLLATDTLIGAQTTAPSVVMNGYLAFIIALSRAATPAEVAQVSEG